MPKKQSENSSAVIKLLAWRYFDYVVLSLLTLTVGLLNLLWRHLETRPPHWDMARHLWTSLLYYQDFTAHHFLPFLQSYNYYPPLVYWLTAPLYLLFGKSIEVSLLINFLFLGILVFSVYGIGRLLWGRLAGILAAVSIVAYPIVATQFKEYQLDAPLMAMVALALLLLIASKEFSNRRITLLFGFVCGLGMLTKWTFVVALVGPAGVALLIMCIRIYRSRNIAPLKNLAIAALIAYAVASVWYTPNLQQLRIDMSANGAAAALAEGDPAVGTWASNSWYFWSLVNTHLYLLPSLLLAVGVIMSLKDRASLRKNAYLLALVVGVYFWFTFFPNKDTRYAMPFLPAVAVLSTFWIARIKGSGRIIISGLVIIYSVAMFYFVSFGAAWLPAGMSAPGGFTLFAKHGYIIGPPSNERWGQEDLFRNCGDCSKHGIFYTGSDTIWFNSWGMRYYSVRYGVPIMDTPSQAKMIVVRDDVLGDLDLQGLQPVSAQKLPDGTTLRIFYR